MDIGSIDMRMPNGKTSRISVQLRSNGGVNVHITRTEEGEALLMLPDYAADRLAELLSAAKKARQSVRPASDRT